MTLQERFAVDHLLETACAQTGFDDFGDEGWRPALELLVDGLINESRLSVIGVEVAYGDLMRALVNRLGVIDWRKKSPSVAREKIDRPIFIVGQPRTGTTILYDLLAQDPELRAPLTWEVDEPCPVPQLDTYHDDPRIAQIQGNIELSEQIVPGFLKYHPMGALVGQECVRITGGEFTSMIYTVQYRLPTYCRWLLHYADHSGAYRYHRKFLQHLQSGVPGQWLLKSPAHLWQLDALLAEYPDALIVQTHRDPLNVISSIAALTNHLRRMSTDDSTVAECAAQSYEEIIVGLEREMALRDGGAIPDDRVIDVKFADFMKYPWSTIGGIYQALGRELRPDTVQLMRDFLDAHPSDGGHGRYTWSDTGLDADEVRDKVRAYQERYEIPTEQLR
ncbi:sulfotransferase [Candidatus Mycobacterium wuenschmannii]|uniref:Sulfotransferase n=1 Tax=Candidatus Mycobacterium wuenschmannii TaxID=3027808 RepID=A0ABY8VVH2_9MYCO|nr:sulfotransferase [Candidatus Mycobacterium wuenschmannii]WIM86774.1 sulfotransferase [Candidatus Mycobacterium wuenschmannii]